MMAPNGTRFGGWLLNTGDNVFHEFQDLTGSSRADILVESPWGNRNLRAQRVHVLGASHGSERHPLRGLVAQHSRQSVLNLLGLRP